MFFNNNCLAFSVNFKINGDSGSYYTFGDLFDVAGKISRGILDPAGLGHQPNDTIGVILPNIPEFAAIVYGATDAGLIVTFANPLYTADEICRQFENAGVTSIFTLPELLPIAQAFKTKTKDYKGTVIVGAMADNRPNKVISYEVRTLRVLRGLFTYAGNSRLSVRTIHPK
jgi:4-coumarate--CoA ligase